MRAYLQTVALYSAIAAACQVAALLVPAPSPPATAALAGETMLVTAIAAAMLALVAGYIAWDAREWSPAMFALACGSVAAGLVVRYVCAGEGLGIEPSEGASFAPVLGVVLGAGWYFLGVQTWWPATGLRDLRQTLAVRTMLVIAATGMALSAYMIAAFPELVPAEGVVRAIAAVAAAGYVAAAVRLARTWRLLRLPSMYGLAAGALLLAPLSIMYGAGGIPGLASHQTDALALLLVAVPVVSLGVEFQARAGLRTVAYGLLLAGRLRTQRGRDARQLGELVDRIAGHGGPMRGHAERVAELSAHIAAHLRLSEAEARDVVTAARLHDLGKLMVPRALLQRTGRLDHGARTVVTSHAPAGAAIAARALTPGKVADAIADHHECWNGAGYPAGKRGDEIGLAARILAVADEYDVLRSARAYKPEWGVAEAVSAIERESGTRFDPRVVQALVRLVANGGGRAGSGEPPPGGTVARRVA